MRKQREILERHSDAAPLGRSTDDGAAADKDIALIRLEHACNHAQQYGLASAGRPEHGNDLTGSTASVRLSAVRTVPKVLLTDLISSPAIASALYCAERQTLD